MIFNTLTFIFIFFYIFFVFIIVIQLSIRRFVVQANELAIKVLSDNCRGA